MSSVAASTERYVAVGWTGRDSTTHGAAWVSADGVAWRRRSLPSATRAALSGVVHDRIGFIAWGYEYGRAVNRAAIWTSPDGLVWRRAPDIPSFAWSYITGIARRGRNLAAVGTDSGLSGRAFLAWTSSDGRTWRPVGGTGRIEVRPGPLAATDKVLVATAENNTVLRSTDGLHWKVVRSPALRGEMDDIVASGEGFLAVGGAGWIWSSELGGEPGPTRAATSTDGRTWHASVLRPATRGSFSLVAGEGLEYVALGVADGPAFAYQSMDGRIWTKMSTAPDTTRDGRVSGDCADGPCPYRTELSGLTDGPRGPVAVGVTQPRSGGYMATVWVLR